ELVLFPTNSKITEKFLKSYISTMDSEKAILPFTGTDVDVVAIFDKSRIMERGLVFHVSIFDLPEEFIIITE
ncbi:MAG: hypothetical protein ABI091_13895, partial [Ferruginibacter sp.]